MINGRPGYKEKDLTSLTWNVRTFFKTGGLIFLLYDRWGNQENYGRICSEGHITDPRNQEKNGVVI